MLGREGADKHNLLSDKQKHLLEDYDSLTADGQNALWIILDSLRITHSASKILKSTDVNDVVQNNSHGNNIYAGGGSSYTFG